MTIVVFDLSDESSLANVARWMDDAAGNSSDPIKFVVGTKKDLVVRHLYCLYVIVHRTTKKNIVKSGMLIY